MIMMAKEWRNMSADAKNKYVVDATKLIENYKIDMKKWEQDMIQAGHYDLLKSDAKSNKHNTDIKK